MVSEFNYFERGQPPSKVVVVTGSRTWRDLDRVARVLSDHYEPGAVLRHGCASGADAISRSFAIEIGYRVHDFWPDYARLDFAEANKRRNISMLETQPLPDIVLAFPTRQSRGTWHCVNAAKQRGIPVEVHR